MGKEGSEQTLVLRRSGPTASAGTMVGVEGLVEVEVFMVSEVRREGVEGGGW